MFNGSLAAGVAALVCAAAGPASAAVVYSGEFNNSHELVSVATGLGSYKFPPGGGAGVGFAETADITVWSTVALAELSLDQVLAFDHFWLSDDGLLDYGIDHIAGDEVVNLLTDGETVRTEHSFTRTVHLPWSKQTRTLVCCEDGAPVPGWEITQWRAGPAILELATASGLPGGKFWISVNDRTPPSSAVPEPGTWVIMIAGFGLMGAGLRRRKSVAA